MSTTPSADQVQAIAGRLSPHQRNLLSLVRAGRTRYLSAFPRDVDELRTLTDLDLLEARQDEAGRWFLDISSAGRAVTGRAVTR